MGTFNVGCKVENHIDRSKPFQIRRMMVDTGSEFTWVPAKKLEEIGIEREKKDVQFRMANGQTITRSLGSRSSESRGNSPLTKLSSQNRET